MQPREPRQPDEPLVDPRVVLHRAAAERIEAGVDPEVARGELGEVAQHLRLGELGQARRLLACKLGRHLRHRQVRTRDAEAASARLRLLVDQLHDERLDEPVDLLDRPLLGHRDEQRVVEARVVAAERVARRRRPCARAAASASRAGRPVRTANSLNVWLLRKHQLEPRASQTAASRTGRAPCRSPPARAAPAGRAGSGAPALRARAGSGWW